MVLAKNPLFAASGDGRTPGLSASSLCTFLFYDEAQAIAEPAYNPGVRDLVEGKRAGSHPQANDEIEEGSWGWHETGICRIAMSPDLIQFVTFRPADAFPAESRSEWEGRVGIEDHRKRRIESEAYLDKGRGGATAVCGHPATFQFSPLFRHDVKDEPRAWLTRPIHGHLLFLVQDGTPWQLVDAC